MIKFIQNRFAMTEKGARNLMKGIMYSTLLNLVILLPGMLVFILFNDSVSMDNAIRCPSMSWWMYLLTGTLIAALMFVVVYIQYGAVYTEVYDESAARRINLAEKLRKLPLAFFGQKNLSDLSSAIMDDCTDLEHSFSHVVPQLFALIFSTTLVSIGMFVYNWQMALSLLWVIPVSVFMMILSSKRLKRYNRLDYSNKRKVTETIQEGIDNVMELQAYGREQEYANKLSEDISFYEKERIRHEMSFGILLNGSQVLLRLGLATAIIIGATLIASGDLSLLEYLVFLVLGSFIYTPISEVLNNLTALAFLDVRIARMKEMQQLPAMDGATDFTPDNYNLTFSNVAFSYSDDRPVIKDLSFTACQGEVTALVGPSGCGKSTSAKLAARFWDVTKGSITLGNRNIKEIDSETLLKYYSVVFQDVVLFNSSIIDNIRIGKKEASDEEVLSVARLTQCDEFVAKLPDGYHTIVGENGSTLSGGERQRLSIARALLKNAPIVLLDEATASLDVENETKIQESISELIKGKTVLVIAHRMRTILQADKVVVINNGVVAESGKPADLIKNNGLFAEMVRKQRADK